MNDKLKNLINIRQALTIGVGVFVGLLVMRFSTAAYNFADDRDMVPSIAICIAILAAIIALLISGRRLYRKLSKKGQENFRYALYTVCFFALLAYGSGVFLHLRGRQIAAARAAARNHAEYQQYVKQHPEWQGKESDWIFYHTLPDPGPAF